MTVTGKCEDIAGGERPNEIRGLAWFRHQQAGNVAEVATPVDFSLLYSGAGQIFA